MTDRMVRWGGAAGVVFVVLILISVFASGSPPKPDDSVATIQKFYLDHRGGQLTANFIGLVATPFVLWFGVVLREVVRRDRTSHAFGTALLIALAVTAPMAMIGGALSIAPVYVDGAVGHLDGQVLRLMFDAQGLVFTAASSGLLTFAAASAAAIQRSRALPAYTMWLALLAVVGNIVAIFGALGPGAAAVALAGVLSFALFVLVAGIAMAMGKASAAPAV
jgi:hypothetical protein